MNDLVFVLNVSTVLSEDCKLINCAHCNSPIKRLLILSANLATKIPFSSTLLCALISEKPTELNVFRRYCRFYTVEFTKSLQKRAL